MGTTAPEHRPVPTFEVEHATDGQLVVVKRSDYDWLAGEMRELRKAYIGLQAEIGGLIPPVDGERANDPIIERVRRLAQRNAEAQAKLEACRRELGGDGDAIECLRQIEAALEC